MILGDTIVVSDHVIFQSDLKFFTTVGPFAPKSNLLLIMMQSLIRNWLLQVLLYAVLDGSHLRRHELLTLGQLLPVKRVSDMCHFLKGWLHVLPVLRPLESVAYMIFENSSIVYGLCQTRLK